MPELDGIRGLAISAVMALHFLYLSDARGIFETGISKVAGYGLWGVDLFFVLSGFLITGILFDEKGREGYFKNFYMRRTLRIFPLYYGVLFLLLVLVPRTLLASFDPELLKTRSIQGWLWSYLTNVYVGRAGDFSIPYLSHFWSLAIEEHFYLFWPLLIARLSRRGAMAACVALSGLALSLRIVLSLAGHELYPQVLTPCRLDTLCLGAFFALAIRGPQGSTIWGKRARAWLPLGALSVIVLSLFQKFRPGLVLLEVRGTVLAAFFALFILTAADEQGVPAIKRLFQARFLGTLGKYSYGLYVFHGLIAYAFERHGLRAQLEHELGSRALATVVQAAAGIGLSLTIAVASYELYEVRFLSLKKLFSDGRARRAEAERKRAPLEHKFVAQAELATPAEPRAASPIAGRGSP